MYSLINKTFKIAVSDRILVFNPKDNESISSPISNRPDRNVEALTLDQHKKLLKILNESNDNKFKNIILL